MGKPENWAKANWLWVAAGGEQEAGAIQLFNEFTRVVASSGPASGAVATG
jgi:hypothetical protein